VHFGNIALPVILKILLNQLPISLTNPVKLNAWTVEVIIRNEKKTTKIVGIFFISK